MSPFGGVPYMTSQTSGTVKLVLSDHVWAKKVVSVRGGLLKGVKIYVMTAVGT